MAAADFFQTNAPYTSNLMKSIPFEKWVGQPELIDLEAQYGFGSAGLPSIARHTAGMSNLSDVFSSALAGKFQTTPDRFSQFLGDVGAFGLGAINEIPGVYRSITGDTPISETWEDIKANALGTFGTEYGVTSPQIWEDVYAGKYANIFDEDEKGTIAFDPNNPQVNFAGMMRRKMMKDRRATQKGIAQVAMQKRIQEAERQRAAAAAAAAQAAHQARQQSTPGYGSAPGGQGFDAGTGRTTTSGWSGRTGQKEMMARGGLASLYG